jgi:hypothetical protein
MIKGQIQQQIAAVNVLNGMPPDKLAGKKINLAPFAERLAEAAFGSRLAPLILVSVEDQMSMPPAQENELLQHGFETPVSPMDNDIEHLQVHQMLMALGDPHGTVRLHMTMHMHQLQAKQAQMQPRQPGVQGKPGGAGPGVAGTPKPGAVPAGPRMMKGPGGMIHPDQMPLSMPRKM